MKPLRHRRLRILHTIPIRTQEMEASEKALVTIVSRNVEGYWYFGDKDEVSTGRNMYLMERQSIGCDEDYWCLGSE